MENCIDVGFHHIESSQVTIVVKDFKYLHKIDNQFMQVEYINAVNNSLL